MIGPSPRRRLSHRQARARLRLYGYPTVCASVALSLDCQNRADLDADQIRLSGLAVRPRDWALGERAGSRTRDRMSTPDRPSTSATSTNLRAERSQPTESSGSGAINQVRSKTITISAHGRSPFAGSAASSHVAIPRMRRRQACRRHRHRSMFRQRTPSCIPFPSNQRSSG